MPTMENPPAPAAAARPRNDAPGRVLLPTASQHYMPDEEEVDVEEGVGDAGGDAPPRAELQPSYKDQVPHHPMEEHLNDGSTLVVNTTPTAAVNQSNSPTALTQLQQQQQQVEMDDSFVPMVEGIPVSLDPESAATAPPPPTAPLPPLQLEGTLVLKKHIIWCIGVLGVVIVIAVAAMVGFLLSTTSNSPVTPGPPPPSIVTTSPTTLEPTINGEDNINSYITADKVAKLTTSDSAAGDQFGYSAAVDGDTLVIGAPEDISKVNNSGGIAYVYTLSGTGSVWTEQAKLIASDGATNDRFGISVAIDGDTLVVGANEWGKNNNSGGRAYVYILSETVWKEQNKLTASEGAAGDRFGISVAIDGDTLVIGADEEYKFNNSGGMAYVFTRSGTVWTKQAKLTASDGAANDWFGRNVALDGDTIVIGAPRGTIENGYVSGSAYVYTHSGTDWTEQTKLTGSDGAASDGAAVDRFGWSVALDGGTIVIGAYNGDSAYVYTRSSTGTVWTEQAKLTASDASDDYAFGFSVAIDGDTIVIGAHNGDTESRNDSGGAYVYTRSSTGTAWTEQAKLAASDGAASDHFGNSVAMDGGTIVIGAYSDDDTESGQDSGSVYIFE